MRDEGLGFMDKGSGIKIGVTMSLSAPPRIPTPRGSAAEWRDSSSSLASGASSVTATTGAGAGRRRMNRTAPLALALTHARLRPDTFFTSWTEASLAASGSSPRRSSCTFANPAPIVAFTTLSVSDTAPLVICPESPATMPGLASMRLASCFAFIAFVTAPTTTRVGHGDLGWLAGGHLAPVTSAEYLNRSSPSSLLSTLSDWSFS
ncbi:hypothetical protein T484DRAFT_1939607 [Baffinella frigidus]|nr:hypothetical protein T484DRAFT_1939607 [Cryptophyta sp. CCMP2293]